MKSLKNLILLTFILIFLCFIYIKVTAETINYTCVESKPSKLSNIISLDIKENYPWIKLWSDYSGEIFIKTPQENVNKYKYIKSDNKLELFKEDTSKSLGYYLSMEQKIVIDFKDNTFKGKCSICKDYCANNIMH